MMGVMRVPVKTSYSQSKINVTQQIIMRHWYKPSTSIWTNIANISEKCVLHFNTLVTGTIF